MTYEEIESALSKLRYQISVLGDTIDFKSHPVEYLIISMDWEHKDSSAVHDVFEEWNRKITEGVDLQQGDFENDFRTKFDIGYQTLKPIILAFYDNGQWTDVCTAYVDSFKGYPPVEYHRIMKRER